MPQLGTMSFAAAVMPVTQISKHSERCGRTMLIEILIVFSEMKMILLCRPTNLLLSRDSHCLNSQDPGMKKKKIAKAFNRRTSTYSKQLKISLLASLVD
jgi:hypothetical protein